WSSDVCSSDLSSCLDLRSASASPPPPTSSSSVERPCLSIGAPSERETEVCHHPHALPETSATSKMINICLSPSRSARRHRRRTYVCETRRHWTQQHKLRARATAAKPTPAFQDEESATGW